MAVKKLVLEIKLSKLGIYAIAIAAMMNDYNLCTDKMLKRVIFVFMKTKVV